MASEKSLDAFLAAQGKLPPASSVKPIDQSLIPQLRELQDKIGVGAFAIDDRAQLARILELARRLTAEQQAALKLIKAQPSVVDTKAGPKVPRRPPRTTK